MTDTAKSTLESCCLVCDDAPRADEHGHELAQTESSFVYAYKYGLAMSVDFFEKYALEEFKTLNVDGCFIFRLSRPVPIYLFSFGFSGFLSERSDSPIEVHWPPCVTKKWKRMNGWFMHMMDRNMEFGLVSNWYAVDAKAAGAVLLRRPDKASCMRMSARVKRDIDADRKDVANQQFMFKRLEKQEEMSDRRSILKAYGANGTSPKYTPEGVLVRPKVRKLQQLRTQHQKWMCHLSHVKSKHLDIPNPVLDSTRTTTKRNNEAAAKRIADLFGEEMVSEHDTTSLGVAGESQIQSVNKTTIVSHDSISRKRKKTNVSQGVDAV